LEACTYTLTAVDNDTDGRNGLPSVTSHLTLRGAGAESTVITQTVGEEGTDPFFGGVRLLHVTGSLTLQGLTLRRGVAVRGGGIFNSGTLTLHECILTGNLAVFLPEGGGIFNSGTLTLHESTLRGNRTESTFGGGSCGGLANRGGRVTIAHTAFIGNGGGIEATSGGLCNDSDGTVTITHTLFDGNRVGNSHGGLSNGGTMTIMHTTFVRNEASHFGGGLTNGGIMLIANTTFEDNRVTGLPTDPGPPPGQGGGAIVNGGILTLTNSTLRGNSAPSDGGILTGGGILTVLNSTLSGNTAAALNPFGSDGGGIFSRSSVGGSVALQNTIVALNTLDDGSSSDCAGPVTSLGTNLLGDPTGCTITLRASDLTGDPGLGDFTDTGRPGQGHFPLLPTSQAIDAGNDIVCPRRDQIGQRRVNIPGVGTSRCDIGAIEFPGKDNRPHRDKDDDHQHDQDLAAATQAAQ
jgi:hypothetical protein